MPDASHIAAKVEKKEWVREYLHTPYSERMPLPVFRKNHNIRKGDFLSFKMEVEQEDKEISRLRVADAQARMMEGLEEEVPESAIGLIEEGWDGIIKNLIATSTQANAAGVSAATLLHKIRESQSKGNNGTEMSAEEVTQRNLNAKEELKREGYG